MPLARTQSRFFGCRGILNRARGKGGGGGGGRARTGSPQRSGPVGQADGRRKRRIGEGFPRERRRWNAKAWVRFGRNAISIYREERGGRESFEPMYARVTVLLDREIASLVMRSRSSRVVRTRVRTFVRVRFRRCTQRESACLGRAGK